MHKTGFLGGTVINNLPADAGDAEDMGSIPRLGRSPGRGHGNPLQYSCLRKSMDRGARQAKSMGSQRVGHDLVIEHKPHRLDLCVTELFVNEFMHFLVYYLCLDSLEIKKKQYSFI